MLYEKRLGLIPEEIKETRCFDTNLLILPAKISGRSVIMEGPEEAFIKWLKPFDGIWVGVGQPFEEKFQVAHIKV